MKVFTFMKNQRMSRGGEEGKGILPPGKFDENMDENSKRGQC